MFDDTFVCPKCGAKNEIGRYGSSAGRATISQCRSCLKYVPVIAGYPACHNVASMSNGELVREVERLNRRAIDLSHEAALARSKNDDAQNTIADLLYIIDGLLSFGGQPLERDREAYSRFEDMASRELKFRKAALRSRQKGGA